MRRRAAVVLALALLAALVLAPVTWAQSSTARVKDVARVVGVRDNELYGYGVVMGLNGTGDRRQSSFFTSQSLQNLLQRQGINIPTDRRGTIDTKNMAAVMVTVRLPAFARIGTTLDVTVSSIGDATSLLGGTLLATPLAAPDGAVYAVASGAISIGGGFSVTAAGTGESVQKNHPTVGRIVSGGIVEREIPVTAPTQRVMLALLYPDFTTASRLAGSLNAALGRDVARAADAATVTVDVPGPEQARLVDFVARLEQVMLPTDAPARIVVNERTGTVIMGSQVRIATVAVSHGNLSIQIKSEFQVSQPPPFAPPGAQTVVVPKTDTTVKEDQAKPLVVMPGGASIGDVVAGLNAIGATPRDLIAILQAIKRAGALSAELEVM
ncbi:MAG: flagellar basal body P-ring protein FlgI [Candidatus Rokubacteria bacterium]|nr:flagellar basal body P-ring protein FlgI [Candidatus Rokubacteria bacterium]